MGNVGDVRASERVVPLQRVQDVEAELEQERDVLTENILQSDLQYKHRVAALLHDAGIFSTMGRRHNS